MEDQAPLALDPFDFHGNPTSRIAGLGGPNRSPDPSYAFHTHYVPVVRGHAHFSVQFDNLRAKRGTLWLRVHMLPSKPGAVASMVTGERIQLNRLVREDGRASLKFEAFRGATYAIMGLILDDTDAEADGLTILIDRPGEPSGGPDAASDESPATNFGTSELRSSPQLISLDRPILTMPVSQPCTQAQLREADGRSRWARLFGERSDPVSRWHSAYVMSALDRYGLLQEQARGLGIEAGSEDLIKSIAGAGPSMDIVTLEDIGAIDEAGFCDASGFSDDRPSYDFLWSVNAGKRFSLVSSATLFVERSMILLKPGGLAIHILPYEGPKLGATNAAAIFSRHDIERLAVQLISRAHDVARLKPAIDETLVVAGDDTGAVPFGIIARRAMLML